jgi:8-oxo-dGTP pyrophosphatase MutT (NUDIX family)
VTALEHHKQIAALPYRKGKNGVEVLLITSRETKRWVIPKGWPMDGMLDHEAAAQEAFEEAGIKGRINEKSIGGYAYQKKKKSGALLDCVVMVYPLEVAKLLRTWPEKAQRKRKWFKPQKAATLVKEDGLKAVIEASFI